MGCGAGELGLDTKVEKKSKKQQLVWFETKDHAYGEKQRSKLTEKRIKKNTWYKGVTIH